MAENRFNNIYCQELRALCSSVCFSVLMFTFGNLIEMLFTFDSRFLTCSMRDDWIYPIEKGVQPVDLVVPHSECDFYGFSFINFTWLCESAAFGDMADDIYKVHRCVIDFICHCTIVLWFLAAEVNKGLGNKMMLVWSQSQHSAMNKLIKIPFTTIRDFIPCDPNSHV